MDAVSEVQAAEAVERELARLRAVRPALSSRIDRAGTILLIHLPCTGTA